jgi:CheY-like chemotaxis protein
LAVYQEAGGMFQKRVLIIDDDAAIRIVVKTSLSMVGRFNVLDASSGPEGLAIALQEHPDAIVLDLEMPGMDGWEVLQHLQKNPLTQPIPVILLTAKADQVNRQKLSWVGLVKTISKPFDSIALPNQISTACGWD